MRADKKRSDNKRVPEHLLGSGSRSIDEKISCMARGMIPASRPSGEPTRINVVTQLCHVLVKCLPSIVYVFPVPVWPYAIMVALYPYKVGTFCTRREL